MQDVVDLRLAFLEFIDREEIDFVPLFAEEATESEGGEVREEGENAVQSSHAALRREGAAFGRRDVPDPRFDVLGSHLATRHPQSLRRNLQLNHRRKGRLVCDKVLQEPQVDLVEHQAAELGRRGNPVDEDGEEVGRAETAFDSEGVEVVAEELGKGLLKRRGLEIFAFVGRGGCANLEDLEVVVGQPTGNEVQGECRKNGVEEREMEGAYCRPAVSDEGEANVGRSDEVEAESKMLWLSRAAPSKERGEPRRRRRVHLSHSRRTLREEETSGLASSMTGSRRRLRVS